MGMTLGWKKSLGYETNMIDFYLRTEGKARQYAFKLLISLSLWATFHAWLSRKRLVTPLKGKRTEQLSLSLCAASGQYPGFPHSPTLFLSLKHPFVQVWYVSNLKKALSEYKIHTASVHCRLFLHFPNKCALLIHIRLQGIHAISKGYQRRIVFTAILSILEQMFSMKFIDFGCKRIVI